MNTTKWMQRRERVYLEGQIIKDFMEETVVALRQSNGGWGGVVYGQATQDGCSLALCPSLARPVPASPIPNAHD